MGEKEYIERERLLDFLQNTYDIQLDTWMARNYWSKVVEIKQKFISCIEKIPSADVVEVRHGEWKLHGNDDDLGSTYWCSHCYYHVDEELFYPHGYDEEKPYNYCPNCGAKMDGGNRR